MTTRDIGTSLSTRAMNSLVGERRSDPLHAAGVALLDLHLVAPPAAERGHLAFHLDGRREGLNLVGEASTSFVTPKREDDFHARRHFAKKMGELLLPSVRESAPGGQVAGHLFAPALLVAHGVDRLLGENDLLVGGPELTGPQVSRIGDDLRQVVVAPNLAEAPFVERSARDTKLVEGSQR